MWVAAWVVLLVCFAWVERVIRVSTRLPLPIYYFYLAGGVLAAVAASFVTAAIIFRVEKSDLTSLYLEKASIKDKSVHSVGVLAKGADITEKRILHEKLTLFASAFEHSTDAMLITDLGGKMVEINPAFTQLFGYARTEAVGNSTRILRSRYSSDDFYRQMWQSITTKGEWKGEIINRAKDGSEIPIWLSITPIVDDGKKVGYMGIEIDMREKKELERRALEAERLAAVGRMSSQVAHEVRNPLSSISLNVELLRGELETIQDGKDPGKISEAHVLLKAIEREVDRLSELAGDYLKFSRLPQHKKEVTNLNDLIATLLGFLREESRQHHIEIVFQPCENLPSLAMDMKQMEQAILNLVKNAFDAMPSGGKIEVGVKKEDKSAVIFVRDEGIGMDEETCKKAFDPFFTTKEKGSGLGLSLVRQVVAEHGGSVWCESVREKGTTFFLRIPSASREEVSK